MISACLVTVFNSFQDHLELSQCHTSDSCPGNQGMDTFASNAVKIKVMECGARRMRNNAKWETFSLRVWRAYEMEQTMIRKTIATAGLALALTTGLAYAQQAGLVNVAINDTEILN